MTIFNNIFIKNMFKFSYPGFCTEWNGPTKNSINTDFGNCIQNFTYGIDEFKNAKKIINYLNERYSDNDIENYIKTYHKLKRERKERIINSQSNFYFKLTPIVNLSSDNEDVWGSKRQYLCSFSFIWKQKL